MKMFIAPVCLLVCLTVVPAAEWNKESGIRVGLGNVPYIFPLDAGGYRLYFCGPGGMLSAVSQNGLDFNVEPGVRLHGCDPSLLKLDDGRYRMYYKIASGPGGPGQSIHKAYSAISQDGVNFIDEGLRLESENTIDNGWVSVPEVVRTFDGRWRMYYVSARNPVANVIASAVSDDGLSFVREDGLRMEGMVDPAVVALPSGQYWLFGMVGLGVPGAQLVIRSATSADGLHFVMDEDILVRSGGPDDLHGLFDPTVIPLPDGSYRMYYGGDTGKTLSAVGYRKDNPSFGAGVAVSAADTRNAELAPGSIASLYGEQLTSDPANTVVEVNGKPATLYYASETLINFAVPESIGHHAVHIIATSPSGKQTTAVAVLRDVSPTLFTLGASGIGEVAAFDTVSYWLGPFPVGPGDRLITLLGTGFRYAKEVVVQLGGLPVEVLYFGPHRDFEGLDQVQIRIPPQYPLRGALSLLLIADGRNAGEDVILTLADPQ